MKKLFLASLCLAALVGCQDNKSVVESCDEILAKLNPQIAKDKQQEQDISKLKSDMNGVKGTLSEIKSLLSDALKLSKN